MKILQKIKKTLSAVGIRPKEELGIIHMPAIPHEDITADNLSDKINNGSILIGETSYDHIKNIESFYYIIGHHAISPIMNIICAYVPMNDIICKYDLLAYQPKNEPVKMFFVLSEAWKMTPKNFNEIFENQLSEYVYVYEDQNHTILTEIPSAELKYDQIISEMNSEDHARISKETFEKYFGVAV